MPKPFDVSEYVFRAIEAKPPDFDMAPVVVVRLAHAKTGEAAALMLRFHEAVRVEEKIV